MSDVRRWPRDKDISVGSSGTRRNYRNYLYDYFGHFRTAQGPYDIDARRAAKFGKPSLPLAGGVELDFSRYDQKRRQYRSSRRVKPETLIDTPAATSESSLRQAYEVYDLVKNGFGQQRLFTFSKTLGYGGYGIVAEFMERDKDGYVTGSPIAIKIPLRFRDEVAVADLDREREKLKMFKNSEHIVQLRDNVNQSETRTKAFEILEPLIYPDRFPYPGNLYNPTAPDGPSLSGDAFPALLMQLSKYGDLGQFIQKVIDRQERVPNQVLNHFFLCLVRMCSAMAYPTGMNPAVFNAVEPVTEMLGYPVQGPDIRGQPPRPHSRIVHFDMDPKNIFIDETISGQAEHANLLPTLKLGDFGLARDVKSDQPDIYYEKLRQVGKPGFFCPEQFTNEWDYIPRDSDTVRDQPIAGNFDWHTNVYGIGLMPSLPSPATASILRQRVRRSTSHTACTWSSTP
ncbi:kinase-like domain-containing protein [Hypoxylon sp. FL1150]|nr:kinase-like domain-containing protein [Hypoxylon sp. FL1150]